MGTSTPTRPAPRFNPGFRELPPPRLEQLRVRYAALLLADPDAAAYSAAALSEIDAALVAARVKGGA